MFKSALLSKLFMLFCLGSYKSKKIVHFNGDGQPIGEGSTSFVSYLGSVSGKHCPISYEHWKDVPDQIKEMIWKLVTVSLLFSLPFLIHLTGVCSVKFN